MGLVYPTDLRKDGATLHMTAPGSVFGMFGGYIDFSGLEFLSLFAAVSGYHALKMVSLVPKTHSARVPGTLRW
jgi:hypothetical protein